MLFFGYIKDVRITVDAIVVRPFGEAVIFDTFQAFRQLVQ